MGLNLKRDGAAVASAVLAFVASKKDGGLRNAAGEAQPFTFSPRVEITPPQISATVKNPRVLLDPKLLTIAVVGVAAIAMVMAFIVRRR